MSEPEATADPISVPDKDPHPAGIASLAMSAESVYGLIVVAGMIVVSRNLTGDFAEALFSVIATLFVFFSAHVYAVAASHLAAKTGGVGQAVRHGVRESVGLLMAGAIPIAFLALGVTDVINGEDAVWLALAADVVLLGILGWFIAASRTRSLWVRISSVFVTAAFGGVLIALKALVHH